MGPLDEAIHEQGEVPSPLLSKAEEATASPLRGSTVYLREGCQVLKK